VTVADDPAGDVAKKVARYREADAGGRPRGLVAAASVGMPITRPARPSSAPPLLPRLIAPLVWMVPRSTMP